MVFHLIGFYNFDCRRGLLSTPSLILAARNNRIECVLFGYNWWWRKQRCEWHHHTPHSSIDSHWIIHWRCDSCDSIAVVSFAFYAIPIVLYFGCVQRIERGKKNTQNQFARHSLEQHSNCEQKRNAKQKSKYENDFWLLHNHCFAYDTDTFNYLSFARTLSIVWTEPKWMHQSNERLEWNSNSRETFHTFHIRRWQQQQQKRLPATKKILTIK